ncbi:MAG TPA: amidohydrolase family protein [Tepidisphaeraceae bacterium]|nr:amidohydrolase family protein [Tepidisphaeraceae bacterium]
MNHAHVFPESMNPSGTIQRLLKLMEACGIDQAVCFAPFAHQCDNKGVDPNAWLSAELKKHTKNLVGFGTIDTRRDDVAAQVRRAKDLGMFGLKMHPNAQSFDILSPRLFEIYAVAEELGMFLTFHSGVHQARLLQTAVLRFDEIAWNFPRLRFSMEHVGGYHFFNEALAVIFNHVPPPWETGVCNVFAGLASVFTPDHNRFWYLGDARLKELAAQVGVRQLIFGLDFPYNLEEETQLGLDTIRKLFTPQEQAQILGGNLKRELGVFGG